MTNIQLIQKETFRIANDVTTITTGTYRNQMAYLVAKQNQELDSNFANDDLWDDIEDLIQMTRNNAMSDEDITREEYREICQYVYRNQKML